MNVNNIKYHEYALQVKDFSSRRKIVAVYVQSRRSVTRTAWKGVFIVLHTRVFMKT